MCAACDGAPCPPRLQVPLPRETEAVGPRLWERDVQGNECHGLSASGAAAHLASGKLRSEDLVRACLDRIETRESEVAAWQYIDPDAAIRQARARDEWYDGRGAAGVLHGVPVAFKDVIDTADMTTTYGSPIYEHHRPVLDAACVALARQAGAVVMGKTVSTEFAARVPGPTFNPHDPDRTPGGSSSGSAAAVADRMVPLAIGTQTAGSTIRPASYCGIYAYKPSFGLLSFAGVRHLAETFDTLGLFARSLDDLELFRTALLRLPEHLPTEMPPQPPRIAFCRTPVWHHADAATQAHVERAAEELRAVGARIEEVSLPPEFADPETLLWSIVHFEMARNLTDEYERHRDGLSDWIKERIEAAYEVPLAQYLARLSEVEHLQALGRELLTGFDAVLTPAAPGEAPLGLADTGPPTFQVIWHMLQMPALTLPAFTGPHGMPVGLQLVGQVREDDRLFSVARWVEQVLL